MKKIFLLFLLSMSVMAQECPNPALGDSGLSKDMTQLSKHIQGSSSCNPEEKKVIEQAEAQAKKVLDKMLQDAQAALQIKEVKQRPQVLEKVKFAIGKMKCIGQEFGKLGYKCKNAKHCQFADAKRYWIFGKNFILYRPHYFQYTLDEQAGTILHEASHKCGTSDAARFDYLTDIPKDAGLLGFWYSIASSYDWWAINGFCVPEINCKKKGSYTMNVVVNGEKKKIALPNYKDRTKIFLSMDEKTKLETLATWGNPTNPDFGLICDLEAVLKKEKSPKVIEVLKNKISQVPPRKK